MSIYMYNIKDVKITISLLEGINMNYIKKSNKMMIK